MRPTQTRTALLTLALLLPTLRAQDVHPMPPDANPSFEVATIKLTPPEDHSAGFRTRGSHVEVENETVESMMMFAYSIHPKQIVDAPDWFATVHYDIEGIPDIEGEPTVKQMQQMLQKLLADRFNLKFHHDKRDLSCYAITLAKGGAKLTPTKSPADIRPDQTGNGGNNQQSWRFTNNSMDDFALIMQYFLDRPIVNQTGLNGQYDFTLKWSTGLAPSEDPNAPPVLFTATQEQLGLRFESTKASVPVLVLDHAERPSTN